jgi:four helix bundle protein
MIVGLGDWGIGGLGGVAFSATRPSPMRGRLCDVSGAGEQILEGKPSAWRMHDSSSVNPKAETLKKRTFSFSLDVIRFCRALRHTWEGRELSDQLIRAGTRVGANYRAACRARSHPDFINKIGYVVEEADESVYWLELIQSAGICAEQALGALIQEAGELAAIFSQSQLTAKTNAGTRREAGYPASRPDRF